TLRGRHPNTHQHGSAGGKGGGRLQVAGAGADVGQAPTMRANRFWRRRLLIVRLLFCGRRGTLVDPLVVDLPIRRGIVDTPEVAGNVEFQADQPGFWIATERNYL